MSGFTHSWVLGCALLAAAGSPAEERPVYEVEKIADHLYQLTADGGGYPVKVIASVGTDGLLVVDTGERKHAAELVTALKQIHDGPPRFIINSHSHIEHVGGNIALGKGAVVIGHQNLRTRLRSGPFLFEEMPDEALPSITFDQSLSLYFNGEEIRLIAFPGSHDSSDIAVWFTGSRVAVVGALCAGHHFPSVDGETGDVTRYPDTVTRLLEVLPEDVRVIPGHGDNCTVADCRAFLDMLVQTTEIVRAGLAAGKDLDALIAEDALASWKSYEISYVDTARWLGFLVDGLTARSTGAAPKPRPYEPLYRAMVAGGVDGAIQRYDELKANEADRYLLDEKTLVIIGLKLLATGRYQDAIRFLELSQSEYPQGSYSWLSSATVGDAQLALGKPDLAAESYQRSLAINPDNPEVRDKLERLEKR